MNNDCKRYEKELLRTNTLTLILYSYVPGLSPSEFYKVRVRSKATNHVWQEIFSLIIEDNDVLYARNYRGKWVGSRVFSFRGGAGQCDNVDVTFKNLPRGVQSLVHHQSPLYGQPQGGWNIRDSLVF